MFMLADGWKEYTDKESGHFPSRTDRANVHARAFVFLHYHSLAQVILINAFFADVRVLGLKYYYNKETKETTWTKPGLKSVIHCLYLLAP